MSYKRKVKQLRLTFAPGTALGPDPETGTDGLVALMRSVPVGTILDMAEVADVANQFTPEGMKALGKVFGIVADGLIEWNFTEDVCKEHEAVECETCPPATVFERPVPPTLEGVRSMDLDEALILVQEWTKAAAGVADPLGPASDAGKLSALHSLPMEPATASPQS